MLSSVPFMRGYADPLYDIRLQILNLTQLLSIAKYTYRRRTFSFELGLFIVTLSCALFFRFLIISPYLSISFSCQSMSSQDAADGLASVKQLLSLQDKSYIVTGASQSY